MQQQAKTPYKLTAYEHIACASVAGCVGNVVGYPMDTIKVRMQTSTLNKGVFDCARNLIKNEGFARLYGGISAQLSVAALMQSTVFGTNRLFSELLDVDRNNMVTYKDYARGCLSGSLTGVCLSFMATPSEQAKILGKSNSPWKSIAYLYRSLGIRGLYRGHGTTMTREVLYYTPYFLTYDTLRKFFQSRRDPVHDTLPFSPIVVAESMVSGGISGCVGWFIILPTDYVKSRMQNDNINNPQYRSVWDCVKQTYRSGGIRQFYTGLSLTLLRAFPVHASVFITMKLLKTGIALSKSS